MFPEKSHPETVPGFARPESMTGGGAREFGGSRGREQERRGEERTLVVCGVLCDRDHFDEHVVGADFGHWVVLYRDLAILYAECQR